MSTPSRHTTGRRHDAQALRGTAGEQIRNAGRTQSTQMIDQHRKNDTAARAA